jgi:hypothetical protein
MLEARVLLGSKATRFSYLTNLRMYQKYIKRSSHGLAEGMEIDLGHQCHPVSVKTSLEIRGFRNTIEGIDLLSTEISGHLLISDMFFTSTGRLHRFSLRHWLHAAACCGSYGWKIYHDSTRPALRVRNVLRAPGI